MRKIFFIIGFFCLFSIFANVVWFYSTNEFSIANFRPPFVYSSSKEPIKMLANQFTYLGHGKQSIVFESADQKHVLKLFYWKRPLRKTWFTHVENWIRFASPAWIFKALSKKKELQKLFMRYCLANQDLREETAIEAVHFNTKSKVAYPVVLIDRFGKAHEIDLGKVPFVLQKKAQLVPEYLNAKLRANDIVGAEKAVRLLQNLLERRLEKGFVDTRQVYKKNYGFIDDKPIQIDIGKIKKDKNLDPQQEKGKITKSLQKFLLKHYPELINSNI